MNALFAYGPRDLRLEDLPADRPGHGQVSVDVARGGICGSDLHYFLDGGFGAVRLKEPMVLGHEVSGVITGIGEGVTGLHPGDLVAVSPSRPCGSCHYCQTNARNHCMNMRFYGSAMPFPHIQGAFRQTLVADATQCVAANGLTAGQAAMAEPLAVCLHAIRRAGPLMGKRVLVTGCGPIGALTILAARRAGAAEIVAVDITDHALGFAKTAGADVTLNTMKNPEALEPYAIGKGQMDVLMECSGAQAALIGGLDCLRPGSVIVQLGMGGDMALPMMKITAKELELRGSFRFHEEFSTAVTFMQDGLIDVSPLITHVFPISEFQDAFDTASDKSRAMKVQLEFTSC